MKKRRKVWPIVLIIALLAVLFIPRFFENSKKQEAAVPVSGYTVGRGDVEVTITGSGMLESADTMEINLPEGVKMDTIFVKEGDVVREGDALAVLDRNSLEYRVAELSAELSSLDRELGSRRLNGTIKTPVKGRIKYQPAGEDDDVVEVVNRYGALAILSTDGMMQVALQTDKELSVNTEVTVKWNDGSASGKVASRMDGGYLITLDDDEAPYQVQAEVCYDGETIGSGMLEIHAPLAVFGNGGTIKQLHYKVGAKVQANATLFTLENEPATDHYRQALADRNEKAEQLQKILVYQKNPHVVSPVSGTVNVISVVEGKKLQSEDQSGEVNAFTLGIGGATKMTVSVDELDIPKVVPGQKAELTLDAFSSEKFTAEVERISHVGTASGSITTYAADLKLPYDERLLAGMNGSAVILSDSVQNVLMVPLGAIYEDANGSYVYVLDSANEQKKTYITTGLSNSSYAEVTGGLNEGDRIAYESASSGLHMMGGYMGGSMYNGRSGQ